MSLKNLSEAIERSPKGNLGKFLGNPRPRYVLKFFLSILKNSMDKYEHACFTISKISTVASRNSGPRNSGFSCYSGQIFWTDCVF